MKKEHLAVRQSLGIFDVSHMGEFWLRGKRATDFLNRVSTRDFSSLADGRAQYCLLLNEAGGIVDDIIVYRFQPDLYWIVVNAANIQKDFKHLSLFSKEFDVQLEDVSEPTALIAVQGPRAAESLRSIVNEDISELRYYSFIQTASNWIIARTGYTGEDGFEVFLPTTAAPQLWEALISKGACPVGLGARDSLRLEVGFPLYGQDLSDELRPCETFAAFAERSPHSYVGKSAKTQSPRFQALGFIWDFPKPMRPGQQLYLGDECVGRLSSGAYSPVLEKGVGLGLIELNRLQNRPIEELAFLLESGTKRREVNGVSPPFVETSRVKKRK